MKDQGPQYTPDELLEVWRRATQEAPLPYKSDADAVLNAMTSLTPDYKYADEIPKMKLTPRFPVEHEPAIREILASSRIRTAFQSLADKIGLICGTDPITLDEWNGLALRHPNLLCVLFDPSNVRYNRTSHSLLTIPIQVTVGAVAVLVIRGFVELRNSKVVKLRDIRYAPKGISGYADYKPILTQATGAANEDVYAKAARNILQEQGFAKVGELH